MPAHNFNHFTGKRKPVVKTRTKKKKPKQKQVHKNKYQGKQK